MTWASQEWMPCWTGALSQGMGESFYVPADIATLLNRLWERVCGKSSYQTHGISQDSCVSSVRKQASL